MIATVTSVVKRTGLRHDPVDLHHHEQIPSARIAHLREEPVRLRLLIPTYLQVTELLIVLEAVRLVSTAVALEVLRSGVEVMQEAIGGDQGRRRDGSHREEMNDQDLLYEDDRGRRMETGKHDPQGAEGRDLYLL